MMKKIFLGILLLFVSLIVVAPSNVSAIKYSTWKNALKKTAKEIEANKYLFGYPPSTKYVTKLNKYKNGNSNCASYISWALQKAGVIPKGKMFSASKYTINGYVNTKKFKYYVPSNLQDPANKKRYHTKTKSLNLAKGRYHWNCPQQQENYYGKTKTAKDINELAYYNILKKGDIISQRDGSGNHLEVYMGKDKYGEPIIYSVGAEYQTRYGYPCSYGKTKNYYCDHKTNYLKKKYILTSRQDCRNNHNHAQVAMIIRIKNMNYKK